jgi:hypothetical protein
MRQHSERGVDTRRRCRVTDIVEIAAPEEFEVTSFGVFEVREEEATCHAT